MPVLPEGSPAPPEDALAFFREAHEFRNVRLAEVVNGDFADAVVRVLLFSVWRLATFERLRASRDHVLAAVAAKGVKELAYHRDYAARWFVTSPRAPTSPAAGCWPRSTRSGRCGPSCSTPTRSRRPPPRSGVGVDPAAVREAAEGVLDQVLDAADVPRPEAPRRAGVLGRTGRDGMHGEALGPDARRDAVRGPRPPDGSVVSGVRLMSRTTERARRVAERVTDPELPMLTLVDLGVLRDVDVVGDSHVVVDITPTYSGCPAMATMRDDLVRELQGAGFDRVEVRVSLDPAWTTDWITPAGPRRARRGRHLPARPGARRRPARSR